MFRKGDRIEFKHPKTKAQTLGVVTKGGAQTVKLVSDDGKVYTGPAAALRRSDAPLPEEHAALATFSKGDRVEFEENGRTVYGTVLKGGSRGGSRVTVVHDGGVYKSSGPASAFHASDVPLPKDDPHPMDDWGLKGYRFHAGMSEETEAFEATITYKGKPVLHARNSGTGGCNSYHPVQGADRDMESRLHEDAKKWAEDHGEEGTPIEPQDTWIFWKANKAPYGVTAKAYFDELNKQMAAFRDTLPKA